MAVLPGIDVRERLGQAVLARVRGPDGDAKAERILRSPGPRWFGADRPIRRVHADAAMFVGGLRALLLQSLHPLAMAAVEQHSGYRGDPWGRLQRTSEFLAVTTYGTAEDAEAAVARVRAVHARVSGRTPYAADDPHLLGWVHVAEIDSFLRAHQRYGDRPLDQAGRDGYVEDTAVVARALGVPDPPVSERELAARLAYYRPELMSTPEARAAARFLLVHAPIPWVARPGYATLSAAAVGLLPWWARWPLRLPWLPIAEAIVVRASGTVVTSAIRWLLRPG
ncbi:MAG: DUF2236 domain-containing protein [Propionibacteriales bacterium]|nr:DUF2236 domain-containing protein [Propionibacteriales bacterium]